MAKKPLAERPLTLKQKAFIDRLLDKGSRSYLNATEAASQVYDVSDRAVAASIGSENLRKPQIINYLERECEALGYGVKVRLADVIGIAKGQGTTEVSDKSYTRDANTGQLKLSSKRVYTHRPSARDRLMAHKLLNDMTGLSKQQDIDREIALREVKALYDRMVS